MTLGEGGMERERASDGRQRGTWGELLLSFAYRPEIPEARFFRLQLPAQHQLERPGVVGMRIDARTAGARFSTGFSLGL